MRLRVKVLREEALEVYLETEKPRHFKLSIYEPPRFIQGILGGKPYHVIRDIMACICGIYLSTLASGFKATTYMF